MVRRPHVSRQVTNIFKYYRVKRLEDKGFIALWNWETSTNKILFTDFKPFEILDMVLDPYYTSARCGNKGSRVLRGGAIVWLPQLLYKPNHNTCKHVLKPIVRIMDMGRQHSFLHSV